MKNANRETELRLLDEHIAKLAKELGALIDRRCKLAGIETGTRKSPRSMLSGKAAERLMGVSR